MIEQFFADFLIIWGVTLLIFFAGGALLVRFGIWPRTWSAIKHSAASTGDIKVSVPQDNLYAAANNVFISISISQTPQAYAVDRYQGFPSGKVVQGRI